MVSHSDMLISRMGFSGFYCSDDVHLPDVALNFINLDLQTSIELAVALVGCHALGRWGQFVVIL